MAVPVVLASLEKEMRDKIETELQFQYKENTIVKSKNRDKVPAIVHCHMPASDECIALPMSWAWKTLGLRNDYESERRAYKNVMEPWNKLQENELAQTVEMLTKERSVALTLRTGAGKTAVCLFCACKFKGFTVVLVHIDDHATQWYNSVKKYTTAKPEIVQLDTNGIDNDTDILICLYTRWSKVAECIRGDVDLLIVDEFDEFQNRTGVESILAWYPRMVLGCTATFGKATTGMNGIGEAVLGNHIVTRQFDVKFKVKKIATGITGTRQKAKYTRGVDWLMLKQSLLYNDERNARIVSLVKIRLSQGRKCMILCDEKKHVKLLHTMLVAEGIDCDWLCDNKKTYKDSRVLVGGVRRCGRGFDEESFCPDWKGERINTLIIADFVKNETRLIQWLGRVFRCKDPIVDHLVDDDKTVQKQWDEMKRTVYDVLGAEIEELSLVPAGQMKTKKQRQVKTRAQLQADLEWGDPSSEDADAGDGAEAD